MKELIDLKEALEDNVRKNWELTITPDRMPKLIEELNHVITQYASNFKMLKLICTMLKYHYPHDTIQLLIQDIIINTVRVNFGPLTVTDGEIPNIIRLNFSLTVLMGNLLNELMEEIEMINPDEDKIDRLSYLIVKNINGMLRNDKE